MYTGGAHSPTRDGPPTTATGLRQDNCSGSELQLIDCPDQMDYRKCLVGTTLTCQLGKCMQSFNYTEIKQSYHTQQHVTQRYDCVVVQMLQKVEWRCAEMGSGEQCVMTLGIEMTPVLHADNWDSLTSVSSWTFSDLFKLTTTDPVAVPAAFFGPGSARIHLSNLQCTGSEAALTDCTSDTTHQCSHNQDASVTCGECFNEDIRIAYDSEIQTVEFCDNRFWNMCDNACQDMNGGKRYHSETFHYLPYHI